MRKLLNFKIPLTLFFIVIMAGCSRPEVSVKPSTRVQVSGKIVDGDENSLSGIVVETGGSFNLYESIDGSNRLGKGISDPSGTFKFTSLDTRNSNFNVEINPVKSDLYNDSYESIVLIDTSESHGISLNFTDNFVLRKTLSAKLNLVKVSDEIERVTYTIIYESSERRYILNNNFIRNEIEYYLDSEGFSSSLSATSPERSFTFDLIEGSAISINYSIDNGPIQDTIITPSINQNTFTLEF